MRMGDGRAGEVVAHCVICSDRISIHAAMVPKGTVFYMPMLASVELTPFFLSLLGYDLTNCFPLQLLQRDAENRQARLYPDRGRHLARKTEKHRYNRDVFQYGSTFVSTLHSPLSLSSMPYSGSPPCSGYSVLTPWFISTEYTCLMSAANGQNGRSGYTVLRA